MGAFVGLLGKGQIDRIGQKRFEGFGKISRIVFGFQIMFKSEHIEIEQGIGNQTAEISLERRFAGLYSFLNYFFEMGGWRRCESRNVETEPTVGFQVFIKIIGRFNKIADGMSGV